VRHTDYGRFVEFTFEQLHEPRLHFIVERGGCLIEYYDRRLLDKEACKRRALLLAPRYAEWAYNNLTEAQRTTLKEVVVTAKDAEWGYYALRDITDLTEAQRTTLKEIVLSTKDAGWAYFTLCNIRDLTEPQRTILCETIAASKKVVWARYALRHVSNLTEAQRSELQKIRRAA